MRIHWPNAFLLSMAVTAAMAATTPLAGAAPSFTVSATNVTMSVNGEAYSQIKVTSVDGYAGTIHVDCVYAGEPTNARLPVCGGYTTENDFKLDADQTITFIRAFYPYGRTIPVSQPTNRHARGFGISVAALLAGVLVFGFGFRRKAWRLAAPVVLCAIVLAGICGCGGIRFFISTTPGTYFFNIVVVDIESNMKVVAPIAVVVD